MEDAAAVNTRKRKKTLNACELCRTRKIKCSGQFPCANCTTKNLQCVFYERSKKVVVSEDYLHELQNRNTALERTPTRRTAIRQRNDWHPSPMQPSGSSDIEVAVDNAVLLQNHSVPRNERPRLPLMSPESMTRLREPRRRTHLGIHLDHHSTTLPQVDLARREEFRRSTDTQDAIGDDYRRLGHSSSWSFSRRVRDMITDEVNGPQLHDSIPIRDGAYGVSWRQRSVDLSDLDLPSEDYAEYLVNTVYFTFGSLYYLFDKRDFLAKLRNFYADQKAGNPQRTGIWHVQMLVIFAFGKSILAREIGSSGPVGMTYFSRAVEAFPDNYQLSREPLVAVETLVLFSLFMQTIDMRLASYQYIGQAARLATTNGWNRRFDIQLHTLAEFEHHSKLWWTVYVIDRKLSSLIGVAPGLLDEDTEVAKPQINNPQKDNTAMVLHIEISSQLGHILNVVYGPGPQRKLGSKFVTAIHSILQRLADTSEQLNLNMKIELQQSANGICRTAASLYILHHQCSILAIRPILFFLLQKKLAAKEERLVLSEAVLGLIRVCVESCVQVLKIMDTLLQHKLIDTLLPHDIDTMFAAAFALVVTDIISPVTAKQIDISKTFKILDDFKRKGVVVAEPYKQDLIEVDLLHHKLKNIEQDRESRTEQETSTTRLNAPRASNVNVQDVQASTHLGDNLSIPHDASDDLGTLRPYTFQSAIDGLNFDFLDDESTLEMDGDQWMW